MKDQIVNIDEKHFKTFAFTDSDIIISSKKHDDLDSLLGSKSGLMESITTIPMNGLKKLELNEATNGLKFRYTNEKGKDKSASVNFSDSDFRNQMANAIAETKGLNKTISPENKMIPLAKNLGWTAVAIFLGVVLRGIATDMAAGKSVEFSGRRSGIKRLLAWFADTLGPNGVMLICGVIALLILFAAFKRWNNPSNNVAFE